MDWFGQMVVHCITCVTLQECTVVGKVVLHSFLCAKCCSAISTLRTKTKNKVNNCNSKILASPKKVSLVFSKMKISKFKFFNIP